MPPGCKSGGTTWWECEEWSREWEDPMEGGVNEIGWCFEGPHRDCDSDTDNYTIQTSCHVSIFCSVFHDLYICK